MKYAVDLVLLAKKETVDRVVKFRCCGMEMNVEKMKVRRISLQPPTVQIIVDQKKWRMWTISATWIS